MHNIAGVARVVLHAQSAYGQVSRSLISLKKFLHCQGAIRRTACDGAGFRRMCPIHPHTYPQVLLLKLESLFRQILARTLKVLL
jgi:hypothetical protein